MIILPFLIGILMTSSAQTSDDYFESYDFTLTNGDYIQLTYQTDVLFTGELCGYISLFVKNTTSLPQDTTYDDFVLVILYDETSIPADNVWAYEGRSDVLIFRHRSYENVTYEGVEDGQFETLFLIADNLPFPYSLMENGTIPYYSLWKQRYDLSSDLSNLKYVRENLDSYPSCIRSAEDYSDKSYDFQSDDPLTFKVVLYYLNSAPANVKLDIHHSAGGIPVEEKFIANTSSVQNTPLKFGFFLTALPAISLWKRKLKRQK